MVFKLPIFEPRTRKQPKQLNTYTKHIVSTKHSSTILLLLIGSILVGLVIFSTPLGNFFTSLNQSKSSTQVLNTSLDKEKELPNILIKNSFNQSCTLTVTTPRNIRFTAFSNAIKETWFIPQECKIEGLKAIRAIGTSIVNEPNSSVQWTHPTLPFSLIAYTSNPEQISKDTLSRHQYQLTGNIVDKLELFNRSKIQSQLQNGPYIYFFDGQCILPNKECGLWRQKKIESTIERIWSIDITNYPIKFTPFQKNGILLLFQKMSENTTQIISIDEEDSMVVLKKTYENTDTALDNYIIR